MGERRGEGGQKHSFGGGGGVVGGILNQKSSREREGKGIFWNERECVRTYPQESIFISLEHLLFLCPRS